MAHRRLGQMSLADAVVAQRAGQNERLDRIAGLLDWPRLAALLAPIHAAAEGRPSYPPLVMFKALLLAQWYSLSDRELEEALADRLSFRRFLGLALDETVPDQTTICRFRSALAGQALADPLFGEVNRQLAQRGLILKRGTLIDATLVNAAVATPPPRPAGERSPRDPDAAWTQRASQSHFGYKAHLAVDQGSGLIRDHCLTPANINESAVADRLIGGDEGAVYADKAYDSRARRERLARLGIADGIARRAGRGQARNPDPDLVARNRRLARIRSAIERTFGLMKRSYNYRRVRYCGLARNGMHLALLCIAINLRRALVLTG